MKLLVCGDFVATESNEKVLLENRDEIIGSDLSKVFASHEYIVCNLEAPITNTEDKLLKAGPNLKITPGIEKGLKELGITHVGLANNHILDYKEKGLSDTINCLKLEAIEPFGYGDSIANVKKYVVLGKDNDGCCSLYACAENEFTIVNKNSSGANPFDPLVSFDDVKKIRDTNGGTVIVLYHGGKEYYRYPSPNLQRICRKFIESGADFVICQHSHCVGCEEKYMGGTIVYGQGNFIFDQGDSEYGKNSLLIGIDTDEDEKKIQYYPIVKHESVIRMALSSEGENILKEFYDRSEKIKVLGFVDEEYDRFCERMGAEYIGIIRGYKFGNVILNKLFYHKKWEDWYKDSELLSIRNVIECEAHREVFLNYLRRRVN